MSNSIDSASWGTAFSPRYDATHDLPHACGPLYVACMCPLYVALHGIVDMLRGMAQYIMIDSS